VPISSVLDSNQKRGNVVWTASRVCFADEDSANFVQGKRIVGNFAFGGGISDSLVKDGLQLFILDYSAEAVGTKKDYVARSEGQFGESGQEVFVGPERAGKDVAKGR
jgi:hypothetical protein